MNFKWFLLIICSGCINTTYLQAYIARIDTFYNPTLNQHIVLFSDIHYATKPQNINACPQQRTDILRAAEHLRALIIVEDMRCRFQELNGNYNQNVLDNHHTVEKPIVSDLIDNPLTYDANKKYLSFPSQFSQELETAIINVAADAHNKERSNKVKAEFFTPPPIVYLSLLAQNNKIPVISVESRTALLASFLGYPISSSYALQSIERVIAEINQYNDLATVKKFYQKKIGNYEKQIAQIRFSFFNAKHDDKRSMAQFFEENGSTDKKGFLTDSTLIQFAKKIDNKLKKLLSNCPTKTSLKEESLFEALTNSISANRPIHLTEIVTLYCFVVDCNILHTIVHHPEYPYLFVCAGGAHVAAIFQTLKELGFLHIDAAGSRFIDLCNPFNEPEFVSIVDYFGLASNVSDKSVHEVCTTSTMREDSIENNFKQDLLHLENRVYLGLISEERALQNLKNMITVYGKPFVCKLIIDFPSLYPSFYRCLNEILGKCQNPEQLANKIVKLGYSKTSTFDLLKRYVKEWYINKKLFSQYPGDFSLSELNSCDALPTISDGTLDLSNKNLKDYFELETFFDLSKVRKLLLNNNKLTSLFLNSLLEAMPQLEELVLSYNLHLNLYPPIAKTFPHLHSLDCSNNESSDLELFGLCRRLTGLKMLYLHGNQLRRIAFLGIDPSHKLTITVDATTNTTDVEKESPQITICRHNSSNNMHQ